MGFLGAAAVASDQARAAALTSVPGLTWLSAAARWCDPIPQARQEQRSWRKARQVPSSLREFWRGQLDVAGWGKRWGEGGGGGARGRTRMTNMTSSSGAPSMAPMNTPCSSK